MMNNKMLNDLGWNISLFFSYFAIVVGTITPFAGLFFTFAIGNPWLLFYVLYALYIPLGIVSVKMIRYLRPRIEELQ